MSAWRRAARDWRLWTTVSVLCLGAAWAHAYDGDRVAMWSWWGGSATAWAMAWARRDAR